MNAQKFAEKNNLLNIKLEIDGSRETIISVLERFQEPIKKEIEYFKNKILAINRMIELTPMSPLTELGYIKEINEIRNVILILKEL